MPTSHTLVHRETAKWLISEAETHARLHGGWQKDRHVAHTTTDMPAMHVAGVRDFIRAWCAKVAVPLLSAQYGIAHEHMSVHDLFFVK